MNLRIENKWYGQNGRLKLRSNNKSFGLKQKGWFTFNRKTIIIDSQSNESVLIKRTNFFFAYFALKTSKEDWKLFPKNLWKLHFKLTNGKTTYSIFGHKGHRVSVFENNEQKGFFQVKNTTVLNSVFVNGHFDDDSFDLLMISIMFIWWEEFYASDHVNPTFSISIEINRNFKEFDFTWQPKLNS
ncbi:MAG: hypothetical protein AAF487_04040 [Bacteroidota bacterium]